MSTQTPSSLLKSGFSRVPRSQKSCLETNYLNSKCSSLHNYHIRYLRKKVFLISATYISENGGRSDKNSIPTKTSGCTLYVKRTVVG